MNRAFTLAEILITIGIIGVVASLTIPSVINDIKYREIQTSLKKQYTLTQQALINMGRDEGYVIKADFGNLILARYLSKYYQLHKENAGNYNYKNYKSYHGDAIASSVLDDGSFITVDGILYMFENAGGGNRHTTYITIDVNGFKKKPNKWGYDLFTFQLTNDGKLLPMGAPETHYTDMETYCSQNSTSNLNGIACAYKAFTEADYFKKLH